MIKFSTILRFYILIVLLLPPLTGTTEALRVEKSKSISKTDAIKAFHYEGVVECSGKLIPGRRFVLTLASGERVTRTMAQVGMHVEKDTPLVQLANDNLIDRLTVLEEKRLQVKADKDTLGILNVKITIAKQAIRRLEKQIKVERKIGEKLPDYLVEGKLKEWIEAKRQREEQLLILRKEKALLEARYEKRAKLAQIYAGNISDVQSQIQRLLIKAPFKGRVVEMNSALERAAAGDFVLEIWDETNLQVKAEAWQHQVQYIVPGYRAEIYPNFYNGFFVNGTVRSIGSADVSAQDKNGFPVFPVYIDFNESPKKLFSGMAVTVKIFSPDKNGK